MDGCKAGATEAAPGHLSGAPVAEFARAGAGGLAPAIARVGGMPHLDLIFLHSESADGSNGQRVPGPPLASI
jgi:hypothetical protein